MLGVWEAFCYAVVSVRCMREACGVHWFVAYDVWCNILWYVGKVEARSRMLIPIIPFCLLFLVFYGNANANTKQQTARYNSAVALTATETSNGGQVTMINKKRRFT
jgi:hypothetical protein